MVSFALFGTAETELIGCIHVDPTDRADADIRDAWWSDWLAIEPASS